MTYEEDLQTEQSLSTIEAEPSNNTGLLNQQVLTAHIKHQTQECQVSVVATRQQLESMTRRMNVQEPKVRTH